MSATVEKPDSSAAAAALPAVQHKPVECSGDAAEALSVYRERVRELKTEQKCKPDMIAYKELRGKFVPTRRHGEIPGVPVGLCLEGKGEAAILGIHQSILSGIDSIKGEPCYAISVQGRYTDNEEADDGTIYYTGEGGQDKSKKHVKDQDWQNAANASLIASKESGTPIRVIRRANKRYYYLGLYKCHDFSYDKGKDGFKVFRFELKPLFPNQAAGLRSFPVDSKHTRRSSSSSLGTKHADKIPRKKQQPTKHPAVRRLRNKPQRNLEDLLMNNKPQRNLEGHRMNNKPRTTKKILLRTASYGTTQKVVRSSSTKRIPAKGWPRGCVQRVSSRLLSLW
ncbi:lysine N-methyltransferase family member [Seminavis robusta]|uniref:Lysine N-methyltransferase family member n=1 Tax=Seminavis robusta TaxID=568900 RepID=A0A9N8HZA4_9STRA|nr:lysine N-methyltransferase family member [Seminavis robusta]|eukprot:Sro3418_g347780.1 lysine N-methyltransferase family member (338) ;mRNA; f:194-1207